MRQVNRYLENKAMDHIDHALGRPVDPLGESYRNYFYVIGDTDLRRYMAHSPHWTCTGHTDSGAYFSVTDEGRAALAAYLKQIGDKHRLFIVTWAGCEMEVAATTRSKALYSKWLDISDVNPDLSFAKFQRESKVRAARHSLRSDAA